MRKPMRFFTLGAIVALVGTLGCCSFCHHRPSCPPGAACPPSAPGGPLVLPAGPPPGAVTFPPASPGVPQPATSIPPPPPTPPSPEVRGFSPPAASSDLAWQPGQNNVRLEPPVAINSAPSQNAQQLPPAKMPNGPAENNNAVLPVGIPQFAVVKDKVANGLRPMLDDGLDWLQRNGYRTVLYLRRPGEEDTSDRKQVEKRGLRYLALEVSPETLTRKTAEEFSRMVGDTSGYPLFVYDRDGALAGGLWYLHFRLVERDPEETARIRAASLGLREDRDDAQRAMWVAIQKVLSE